MKTVDTIASGSYDLVLVGSGFGSSFFLWEYLQHAPASARVRVLEKGRHHRHAWQLEQQRNSAATPLLNHTGTHRKDWQFNVGFGGGSNCWWACTPRFLPNDFRLKSAYGVGDDWPVSYDELEAYYAIAEQVMQVSGPEDYTLYPRAIAYPQPPHLFSDVDCCFKQHDPAHYYHQPTARASIASAARNQCCGNGVCQLCPVNAKFTIENGLEALYADPRVSVLMEAEAAAIVIENKQATGVSFQHAGRTHEVKGDLIALGANAIYNPVILQASGLEHPLLGKRLHEQVSVDVLVDMDGVENFQGSTSITGHWYALYDGEHRREHAGCLIECWNIPNILRSEQGRWRETVKMKCIFEDLPQEKNYVRHDALTQIPQVHFDGYSDYAKRGITALDRKLEKLLQPLPVERIHIETTPNPTEAHMIGTTVMGNDPANSVLARDLSSHQVSNLVVLGSGAFPTCSPSNPTLTICALSLWSARNLMR